jgi:hypothetical protein
VCAPSISRKGADMLPHLQALLHMPRAVERRVVGYSSAV